MSSQFPQENSGLYRDVLTGKICVSIPIQDNPYLNLPDVKGDFPPPSAKNPTIGDISRRTWLHQRAVDLSLAIANYSEVAEYGSAYDLIDELDEILDELRLRAPKELND